MPYQIKLYSRRALYTVHQDGEPRAACHPPVSWDPLPGGRVTNVRSAGLMVPDEWPVVNVGGCTSSLDGQ